MPATLPTFSRGLKLVRLAVFALLLQLAATFVMTVKGVGGDSHDAGELLQWTQYFLLVNAGVTLAMFVGVVRAIPELARSRMDIGGLVIAAAGFAIATAALAWSYYTLSTFVDIMTDPNSSLDDMMASLEDVKSMRLVVIIKDLAYAIGLITMVRTVQRSAAFNDQLALRDAAGSMSRALIVMLGGDVFYQLTYGLGGAVGILGLIGSLLVGIYWIYCHLRLAGFLYNAAHFVNEAHNLPLARVVRSSAPAQTASPAQTPPARPSQPLRPSAQRIAPSAAPPPIVVVPPAPPVAAPIVVRSDNEGDAPRFLL